MAVERIVDPHAAKREGQPRRGRNALRGACPGYPRPDGDRLRGLPLDAAPGSLVDVRNRILANDQDAGSREPPRGPEPELGRQGLGIAHGDARGPQGGPEIPDRGPDRDRTRVDQKARVRGESVRAVARHDVVHGLYRDPHAPPPARDRHGGTDREVIPLDGIRRLVAPRIRRSERHRIGRHENA
jgi:hypothetical protein